MLRTLNTIPLIANVVKAAAINRDIENLALAGKNLWEETGKGNESNVHINLLINAYSVHADHIFGLEPVNLPELANTPEIIPETHEFLDTQNSLYTHPSYNIVIGANYAQESTASGMLKHFYNSFFKSYINHYNDSKIFSNISEYFNEHLDGTEEEHAANAERIVEKRCCDKKNLPEILYGINGFLEAQSQLWDGLHRTLKSLDNNAVMVEF